MPHALPVWIGELLSPRLKGINRPNWQRDEESARQNGQIGVGQPQPMTANNGRHRDPPMVCTGSVWGAEYRERVEGGMKLEAVEVGF